MTKTGMVLKRIYSLVAEDNSGAESTPDSTEATITVNAVNDQPTLTAISNPAAIDEDASVNKR